ncbi:hypothetical protein SAMN04488023_15215 [Pedobacter rhizosphaerae]|uniref:Uncharacterized protein n=1 Tax=Pedobacter rhizosphaerae TaxID=390241 RepID=A0A1H9VYN1_9SPHI|nr:hypothetical protein SAMN04488023_15215 [Pedobacter rhizosphaerae]
MNIQFFIVGVCFLIVGVILMWKYKFFKYKAIDTLFYTELKVFLGALILAGMGLAIIINELKKVIN